MKKTKLEKQMERVQELAPAYLGRSTDISVYQELHWLMWDWVTKNPSRSKASWPGWDYCKSGVNACFACQYTLFNIPQTGEDDNPLNCGKCPVKYHCNSFNDPPMRTIYNKWMDAHYDKDKRSAKKYALLIRDCWPINHEKKEN